MRSIGKLVVALLLVACGSPATDPAPPPRSPDTEPPQALRIATYNIRFLNAAIPEERAERLRRVVDRLDADVIGLQEIEDRAALERIFSPRDWQIVIDDDARREKHDLALVVRRPFRVLGLRPPFDAGPEQFAFYDPRNANNRFFPNTRDLLRVSIGLGDTPLLTVFVHHAASRRSGRRATDPRREGAAREIVRYLEDRHDGELYVLLGDFNDTPDDRSLNILETGDPRAAAGMETRPGPFLLNLTEPLYARGHVSFGRSPADVAGGRIDTVDRRSRRRNDETRGRDERSGDALFDQILIPVRGGDLVVPDSTRVFDHPSAVEGPYEARASDHLPVVTELRLPG